MISCVTMDLVPCALEAAVVPQHQITDTVCDVCQLLILTSHWFMWVLRCVRKQWADTSLITNNLTMNQRRSLKHQTLNSASYDKKRVAKDLTAC
jgi:hypothetical protein